MNEARKILEELGALNGDEKMEEISTILKRISEKANTISMLIDNKIADYDRMEMEYINLCYLIKRANYWLSRIPIEYQMENGKTSIQDYFQNERGICIPNDYSLLEGLKIAERKYNV